MSIPDNIINKQLYEAVKADADKVYKRAGLFKSAWIQREYVKRGGKYSGTKPSSSTGLNRWLKKEKWIAIIPYLTKGETIQCGSVEGKMIACRPLIRANDKTPITLPELIKLHGKDKILELARYKEKNPTSRINWKNAKIY